jgi:CHAT domain-containing protein/tetratricopeptide (TPR) repeat protein
MHASRAQDPAAVDARLREADRLAGAGEFELAMPLYDAALAEAREQAADRQIAHALAGRANVHARRRRFADGLPDAREALAIYERLDDRVGLALVSSTLSVIEEGSGRTAEAMAMAERSMTLYAELGDRRGEARAGLRLGDLLFDPAALQPVTDRTVAAARVAGDLRIAGQALHRLGDIQFAAEHYEESMEALLAAKAAFEAAGATLDLGTVHNSIGRLYRVHGRLDDALREQQRALALHERTDTDAARIVRLQSLNAVAVSYQRLGDLVSARSYLEQALALAPTVSQTRAQDFLQANMAVVLADLGQLPQAAAALEQVLARGTDAFPSIRHAQLSTVYDQMGRHADALAAADRAIATCGTNRGVCASARYARAEAEARLGDRSAARADFATALGLIEELRAQLVPADFFRQEFYRSYQRGFTTVIGLHLADGDAAAAMEAAEQARARAFLDLLASRTLSPRVGVPSRSVPLTLRGGGSTPDRPVPIGAAPATAAELVATAGRLGSTLVSYWVGTDETFVWVVAPSGRVVSHRIPVSQAALARLVRQSAPFVEASSPATPAPTLVTRGAAAVSLAAGTSAWKELYALLVAPIRSALPTAPGALLTIVPHDVLSHLSFAALQSPRGRYLLEDFTLHYAPAGAMFQFTEARRRADARNSPMLLVADPVPPRRSPLDATLPRLPGARSETVSIARVLRRDQAVSLQDTGATEARVRELARERGVLHFATHAVVRDDDPFASFLALGASGKGPAEDGVLTAEEVYGLSLEADLVVLSACRSAAGTVAGDGIATFARAFLYAGTASLVASLWDVADEPTNRLVPAFYRAWRGGADKAAALRKAQLQLLADLRAGRVQVTTPLGPVPVPEHPVFWAGFALFGEPR